MTTVQESEWDVVVVGGGSAGFCAAISAKLAGASNVLILEKASENSAGGNTYFTAGALRFAHGGLPDLLPLLAAPPSTEEAGRIDIEPYSAADFAADIQRLADGRSDPALVAEVATASYDAVRWLVHEVKIPLGLAYNRQAYEVDGRQVFWGGLAVTVIDGGRGMIAAYTAAAARMDIVVEYSAAATALIHDDSGAVCGVQVGTRTFAAKGGVVLACGGFSADRAMRTEHLGAEWAAAKVRGTPCNTGDAFALVGPLDARRVGDWAGCHATCWDFAAPDDAGDRSLTNQFTKSGYPLGIMVNALGARFCDEGEDFRNFTYARFGKLVLKQPHGYAFQLWDEKVVGMLRSEEYGEGIVKRVVASTIQELASKLAKEHGLKEPDALVETIADYNAGVVAFKQANPAIVKWDPTIKDGMGTNGIKGPPKTNWALTIDEPPFVAVKVTCGITFTFGGLAVEPQSANVITDAIGNSIPGLYATGEVIGGLWFGNYPGGSGLVAGAVFGRKAGEHAAHRAKRL